MILPFRKMSEIENKKLLSGEIIYCMANYLGISESKNDREVIRECIRFVNEKFSFLGSGEIRQAFSMCSAGEFKDLHLRAYFGIMTVDLLGQVLRAYKDFRKIEVAKIEVAKEERLQESKALEAEIRNKNARAEICIKIKQAISGEIVFSAWESIPVHWGELAIQENIIQPSAECKKEIWQKSLELAKQSKLTEQAFARDAGKFILARNIQMFLETVEVGEFNANKDFKSIAKSIYSKLILFQFFKK